MLPPSVSVTLPSTFFLYKFVFSPILGSFYHQCDVTNGIKISEIYKMDVTNEFVVPKCIHPAYFTFLRSCCQYMVSRPILGPFYPCDVTNGIKISEIYKMDVTNEFVVPKCFHPAYFTFLRSVVNIWCLGPFWALFTPVTSQMGSRSPKFTKWMSPTSLSSQNVSTLHILLFYDLLLSIYGVQAHFGPFLPL